MLGWLTVGWLMAFGLGAAGSDFSVELLQTPLYTNSSNSYNVFFLAKMAIGTPQQHFSLLVDTGSSMLWVYSSNCQSPQVCDLPPSARYDASLSSTSTPQPGIFTNSYGGGAVKGNVVGDIWNVTTAPSFQQQPQPWEALKNLNFGVVTAAFWSSTALASPQVDGFLGLTIPSNQTSSGGDRQVIPLLQLLAIRGLLSSNLFGFGPSLLSLGGYPSSYQHSLNWVSVQQSASSRLPPYYWWIVPLQSLLVDGQPYGPCGQSDTCQIMLDTGAGPLFMGPSLPGLSIPNSYPCSQASLLPTITFVIAGQQYTFSGSDYSLDADGTCWSQINQDPPSALPSDSATIMLQFGAPWFQKYYTVHDADNLRVGISPVINSA